MSKQRKAATSEARQYTSRMVERLVPISTIHPHPDNPRQHPDTQIVQMQASHEDLGQFEPVILWQRPDSYIQVKGHGYIEGVKLAQDEAIKAWILPEDTPPVVVKRIMLASNLHAMNSFDDDTLVARLLQEQQDRGVDLAVMGTDVETLLESLGDGYLAGDGEEEEDNTQDELPEEVPARSHLGDIWKLGRHKIACLNSCDPEQVKRLFTDVIPHMVWSDPPYGIAIVATNVSVGGGEAHIAKTYMESNKLKGLRGASKPFGSKAVRGSVGAANVVEVGKYYPVIGDDSTATAIAAYRLCSEFWPHAVQIWWGANYYANALPPSKCWLVWDKENTGNFADAELAWCSDDSAVRIFKHMWNGMLKDSEHGQRRVHPTQKPVALAQWAFEKYGKERDVIYDPFLGSGISVIAAERLNDQRTVYGCELSPEYIDVIIKRWETLTGQSAHLLDRVEVAAHG